MSLRSLPPFLALTLLAGSASADVRLPQFLSDHMVLQRDRPVAVWGFADPGESVRASFAGQELSTAADAEGRWRVVLEAMPASASGLPLTVRGASNTVTIEDVVVGEVWLCSGQSNMVLRVEACEGAEEAKAGAQDPRIRMFTGALVSTPEPQDDLPGRWLVARPDTVGGFSAAAYYFGRDLLEQLDVPIGLLNVSWGGSSVEAWTTMEALRATPAAARTLEEYEAYAREAARNPDPLSGLTVDDSDWEKATLPAMFKDIGHDIDGVIWFRRRLALPAAWRGRELVLELGQIDDEDNTYVQGVEVGHTDNWQAERRYLVPAGQTAADSLTFAVRVRDGAGPGGFRSESSALRLFPEDGESEALSLAGEWRARVTSTVSPPAAQHLPAHLYNGMLHPLLDYAVRGVIWYQGENNAIREAAVEYYGLFPAFIRDLRAQIGRPELPFVFVQLPNFAENDSTFWNYPIVRDAQLRAFRSLPRVGMAVTTDIGEADDIHPRNKRDVGLRLARWALSRTYGLEMGPPTGPIFDGATFEGGEVRVWFRNWGSGLSAKGGAELGGFVLAGEDRAFHPARARIEGNHVVVDCDAVAAPRALRYGWGNDPKDANLVDEAGLPASPFRTDDWPLF